MCNSINLKPKFKITWLINQFVYHFFTITAVVSWLFRQVLKSIKMRFDNSWNPFAPIGFYIKVYKKASLTIVLLLKYPMRVRQIKRFQTLISIFYWITTLYIFSSRGLLLLSIHKFFEIRKNILSKSYSLQILVICSNFNNTYSRKNTKTDFIIEQIITPVIFERKI